MLFSCEVISAYFTEKKLLLFFICQPQNCTLELGDIILLYIELLLRYINKVDTFEIEKIMVTIFICSISLLDSILMEINSIFYLFWHIIIFLSSNHPFNYVYFCGKHFIVRAVPFLLSKISAI